MVKMQRSSTDQLNHPKNEKKLYTPEPRSPESDTKPASAEPKRDEHKGKKKQNPNNKSKDAVKPLKSNQAQGKIALL